MTQTSKTQSEGSQPPRTRLKKKTCSGKKLVAAVTSWRKKQEEPGKFNKKEERNCDSEQNGVQKPNKDFHPAFPEIKKGNAATRKTFHFIPSQSSYEWIILLKRNCGWERT